MIIINTQTGEECPAVIERLHKTDYKAIKASKEYQFDWSKYRGKEVYKLRLEGTTKILGLICIIPYPQEGYKFLKIEVIEVGETNKGKRKEYDRIAGCLIAFACKRSFIDDCTGVVMLIAKTDIANLYHTKYGFQHIGSMGTTGERMVSDYENTNNLIKEYLE